MPFAAVLCLCSFVGAQENQQQTKEAIRISVDRVNGGVMVTDHSGHFVEGLRREDFHVSRLRSLPSANCDSISVLVL